ncbi:MAG: heavy metal translocating P-type ATPase, partial [Enterobacteriaceae bacterium]
MFNHRSDSITVIHSLPGRVRLRVPQLRTQPQAAGWVKQQLLTLTGVNGVRVRAAACSVVVTWQPALTDEARIVAMAGELPWHQAEATEAETEYCNSDNLLNVAGLALSWLLPGRWASLPALILTAPTIVSGLQTLSQRQLKVEVLDAMALSLSLLRGDYSTAMITQSLLTLGEYLEQKTSRHSDQLLAQLMQPREHPVWVERDSGALQIESGQLQCGDIMLLGPGDNIAADGTVIRGMASVNQSSMTGESVPVRREKGAWVYAGTQVQEGNIAVRAELVGEGSSTALIRRFIVDALGQRSETQQTTQEMADRRVAITLAAGAAVFALTRDWQKLASVFLVDYSCAL